MKVSILTIGNELTSGRIQDTNSSFIARMLNALGLNVLFIMSVGDNEKMIGKALDHMVSQSECVIVTGGLGPTADDITTAALARFFGLRLYTNEMVLSLLKERFDKYRLKWTSNNEKQAMFPEGAELIPNPHGTAWGYIIKRENVIIAVIPGVPSEAESMLSEGVIPVLKREFPGFIQYIESKTIKLFGLTEARVDQALSDIDFEGMDVNIGFYPNFPEIHVVFTARSKSEEAAKNSIKLAEELTSSRLQQYIVAYDKDTIEAIVARRFTEKGLTLALAESCTGGLIADRLTNIPGSSVFFERGIIAYSNKCKTDILGVPEGIIKMHGAVSEEVAVLMADGARRIAKTDIGLATTGIAGPGGGSLEKPTGTVFIAIAADGKTFCKKYAFRWDRKRVKLISSEAALVMLNNYLAGGDSQ